MCTWAHRQSLAGCSYGDLTVHLADGWTGLAEDVRVHLVNRAAPKQRAQLRVSRNGRCEGGAFCTYDAEDFFPTPKHGFIDPKASEGLEMPHSGTRVHSLKSELLAQ